MPFSMRLASQFRVYQFHRTIHDSLAGHHDHLVHPYRSSLPNFIVIGAAGDMSAVWTFSDAMILALVFPNMIGLILLYPKVKEELTVYLAAIKGKKS